jgi:hypothetical protein
MYVPSNDTAAPPVSVSPPRALENVEARLRRMVEHGGARSAQTRAVLGRLEAEREIWQQADEETIRRWELLHARYLEYRREGRASARGGDAQGRAGVLA